MLKIIFKICALVIFCFIVFGLVLPMGLNSQVDAIVLISQIATVFAIGYAVYYLVCIVRRTIKYFKRRF